ncbi:thiol-disulfide oxidoreductase DCC family protein [Streptomyces sp. NPDC127190]|uniref:thiol-disulfide oxidoreductase DCC family protein n=1 Tax=unclassified Streptomyces TaxID=2593676 RepID=UPI0036372C5A
MKTSSLVLAYDGDCGFCQASVDRIRALARPAIDAVPWQFLPEETTAPHLRRLETEVLLLDGGTVVAGGADALARFAASSPARAPRAVAALVGAPGVRALSRAVYRQVARHRHRLPGSTPACAVPPRHA